MSTSFHFERTSLLLHTCLPSPVPGIEAVEVTEDTTPLIVGERTNVIGSRKFKKMIAKNEFEKAAEIGRKQDRGGAHIIDVCMADPDREKNLFLPLDLGSRE